MSLNRNVPLGTGLRYRGEGTQLAFVLHRIGGLGMASFFAFLASSSFVYIDHFGLTPTRSDRPL